MEFQIFRLVWMLGIHRIHTKPSFKISADTPVIEICYDSHHPQPKWTIQVNLSVTETELQSYQDPIEIYVNTIADDDNNICNIIIDDISVGKCRPQVPNNPFFTDEAFCYCASSGNDWYNLKITQRSYYHYNEAKLLIKFPFEEYEEKFPVTLLATTCFNFWPPDDGVIQTRTLNAGDIWNAYGKLDVAFVDKPGYGHLVKVKKDGLLFCTIDVRQCPPTQLPTGDIICYCSGKDIVAKRQIDRVYLNVTATAQGSQSRAILTTEFGPVTGIIGVLPKIKGQITPMSQGTNSPIILKQSTTQNLGTDIPIIPGQSTTPSQGTNLPIKLEQSTTEENRIHASSSNVWLKLLLFYLAGICTSVALWSFTKLRRERKQEFETFYTPTQFGFSKYGSTKYGSTKYGSSKYGSTKYGSTKYGSTKYRSTKYGSTKYGSTKYGSPKYGSNSIETEIMESTPIDHSSFEIHSKYPQVSTDENTYPSTYV